MRKVFGEQSFYLEDSVVEEYQEQTDTPSISVIFDQPYDGGVSSIREKVESDATLFGSEDAASFNDSVLPTTLLESVESSLSGSSENASLGSLGVPTRAFEVPTGTPVHFSPDPISDAVAIEMEATLIDGEKGGLPAPSAKQSESSNSNPAFKKETRTAEGYNPFDASRLGTDESDFSKSQFRVNTFRSKKTWPFVSAIAAHVRPRAKLYLGGLFLVCILGIFLIENSAKSLPEQIDLDVGTTPSGAFVFLGGKALDQMTPSTLTLKTSTLPITLMLQRDGYETVEVLLDEELLIEVEVNGTYRFLWELESTR